MHHPARLLYRLAPLLHRPARLLYRLTPLMHRPARLLYRLAPLLHRPAHLLYRLAPLLHRPTKINPPYCLKTSEFVPHAKENCCIGGFVHRSLLGERNWK
ncbi:hypothetical protein [Nostoc sp.]|uniref:hypothetical protein n=1 Tax=Nostoc sp. TaxID=1180 RepID=UPI002FFCBC35